MINRICYGFLALALSTSASAAISQAQSKKYFDESGIVVGQQIATCSNFLGSYGNIHTAYSITEILSCSGGEQHPDPIVAGTHITAYTLPGYLTIQQACSIARCAIEQATELEVFFNKDDYGPYNQ